MGEARRKLLAKGSIMTELGNGDEKRLTTHIVEVVDVPLPSHDNPGTVPAEIEAAYLRIADRAKAEESLVMNVVQSVDVYQPTTGEPRMLVTITAARITFAELERQQRLQRVGGR